MQIFVFTKQELEQRIMYKLGVLSRAYEDYGGYMPKDKALECILQVEFCTEGWNEELDEPATSFTTHNRYGIRYFLYSPIKKNVINKPMKEEEALKICEKILNSMNSQGIVEFSKSGKGVKYTGKEVRQ